MNAINLARHDMRRLSTSLPGADGTLKQGELARVEIIHPDGTYVVSVLRERECPECQGSGWHTEQWGLHSEYRCDRCGGHGVSKEQVNITVDAEAFRKATAPQRERADFWQTEGE